MSASVVLIPGPLRRLSCVLVCLASAALAGCLGEGEAAERAAAQREADGKAVGSACRHAGRAIEDCYTLNPKAQRAAVFAGWREMDEYMRENKLEAVAPSLPAPEPKTAEKAERKPERSEKTAEKATEKHADKPEPKSTRAEKRAAAEPPAEVTTGKVDLPPKPRVIKHDPS